MEGENAGDPTTVMSTGPGYIYATSNLTNLYNRPNEWNSSVAPTDVTQATRSILWLNNDYIVVYDRATTNHSGFKIFNLAMVTNPVVNGNTATETLGDGQQLFVQTLLPLSPSFNSFNGAVNMNPIADTEPTQYIYQVQDAAKPADTRFLHVLQGADPGAPMTQAAYVQSASGTPFDGTAFGANEVWFPVSAATPFGGATFPAAAGVHTMMITGLTPNAGYSVSVQPNGTGSVASVFPNGTSATADAEVC